jgi:hypothetical protein
LPFLGPALIVTVLSLLPESFIHRLALRLGFGKDIFCDQIAIPSAILGGLPKCMSIANKNQSFARPGHGDVQSILVQETSGFLHQSEQDQVCFLSLALINCQNTRLGKALDGIALQAEVKLSLLVLVL